MTKPAPGLTRQGVLDLDVPEAYWINHVEKTRMGLTVHPCASCGGLGWFTGPGESCPGCKRSKR